MAQIRIENVDKRFGSVTAVDGLNLTVNDGELVSLLGPSGCGKTTTLRMLAGLESVTSGTIRVDGQVINDLPPQDRSMGIVFQDYAIFQTMTVERNVGYGLAVKRVPVAESRRRIGEALELVGLGALAKRMPSQLSGGQLQRVALARALVIRPKVLLLDEPLSNLDAALRQNLRQQIRQIQQELAMTAIFVTHDQEEAMSISDRIAVMDAGKMVQFGTPEQIYEAPSSAFVAGFIGRTNLLRGEVKVEGDRATVRVLGLVLTAHAPVDAVSGEAWVSIRPQDIRLVPAESSSVPERQLRGRLTYLEYLGSLVRGEAVLSNGQRVHFEITNPRQVQLPAVGADILIEVDSGAVVFGNLGHADTEVLNALEERAVVAGR